MEVTTNIKKSDLIKFNLSVVLKIKSTYISILVIALFAFVFITWKNGLPTTDKQWAITIFASLSGGLIATTVSLLFNILLILFMSSSKAGVMGEHHYRISSDGLHEKTTANEGLSKWIGIAEIITTDSYLFFKINGYLYHIIPKRCFSSPSECDSFLSEAMQHWKDAHE